MLDEGVVAVSASSVYRVLREADLVCRWKPKPKVKGRGRDDRPTRPDQKWQTDIKYVRVGARNYYLLSFMDVYSRYIVHDELLRWMDGQSVSTEAAAAIATLDADVRPDIQSDHGSGFLAREFAETLSATGVTQTKIRPHTPTDNTEIGIIAPSVSASAKRIWRTSRKRRSSSRRSSAPTTTCGFTRRCRS